MNIYDQILTLPRSHRLALAGWILRTNSVGYDERRRIAGCRAGIGQERKTKELTKSMKVTP